MSPKRTNTSQKKHVPVASSQIPNNAADFVVTFVPNNRPSEAEGEQVLTPPLATSDLKAMFSSQNTTTVVTKTAAKPAPKSLVDNNQVDKASLIHHHRRDSVLADMPHICTSFPYSCDNPYTGVCWWDAHSFETDPICIPTSYDIKNRNFTNWHGVFCSWSCAFAYARANSMHKCIPYMHQIRLQIGLSTSINRAPHFSMLATHGGTMSVPEFRNGANAREY